MGTVITNMKARFGVDTKDFKDGLKDGAKAVDDFRHSADASIDELADVFGINMGAVNNAVNTMRQSLNFLSQSFVAAAKGGQVLTIAMKVLRTALISTGIGALIVALGSLIAYFTKTGEGTDKVTVALGKIRSVIDTVISRVAALGEGLFLLVTGRFKEGWERMKDAVKGFGDELKENWKAAGDLAKRELELYNRETALVLSLEQRRQKMEELRLAAKDLDKTETERQAALAEALRIRRSMMDDEVKLEADRLAIMKEKLSIATKDPTSDQLREIAEQEAKLASLRAEGARQIRRMSGEYNTLTKAINAAAEAQRLMAEEAEKAWLNMAKTNRLEMPELFDIKGLSAQLAEVKGVFVSAVSDIDRALSSVIENSLENFAVGIGEFLGDLATGKDGLDGFGKLVAETVGTMAVQVGKIAIATGVTLAAIKTSMATLQPGPLIAAGIALVALGSAVKNSLAAVGSPGTAGVSIAGAGAGGTFDLRTISARSEPIVVSGRVELVASGRELKGVLDMENQRRRTNT